MSRRDPEAFRIIGLPMNMLYGAALVVVGLIVGFEYGGRAWIAPLLGAALIALSALMLKIDPPGGRRR